MNTIFSTGQFIRIIHAKSPVRVAQDYRHVNNMIIKALKQHIAGYRYVSRVDPLCNGVAQDSGHNIAEFVARYHIRAITNNNFRTLREKIDELGDIIMGRLSPMVGKCISALDINIIPLPDTQGGKGLNSRTFGDSGTIKELIVYVRVETLI
jgi:hypothetical protein